jgi:predicted nuclease of predicted toxin-antitoxin system
VKFLTDQDVYATTVAFLRNLSHDVLTAAEIGCSRASDTELLRRASAADRLFVTRDKDFGGLVFVSHLGSGVILIRAGPSAIDSAHEQLERLLSAYSEDQLRSAFVVVEPGMYRFRKLS